MNILKFKMTLQNIGLYNILINLSILGFLMCNGNGRLIHQASVGELYSFKIVPSMFNWTHQFENEQFRYTPSLKSYPDLPSWMRYMYSDEHHAGFLYGTTPESLLGKSITLDIVALNRRTYETRYKELTITITHKIQAPNVIQMKIDNLDLVHLMDPGRLENLRNIYRKELWPESNGDLSVVFMESAINMGGRLPLSPQQHEGVIVHLGSFARFSERLKDLQEEVKPLYKLLSCSYKRTSVQKIFENAGFKLDWCAFKIVSINLNLEVSHHNHNNINDLFNNEKHLKKNQLNSIPNGRDVNIAKTHFVNRWHGVDRDDVPIRNYIDEFAFAFAIPIVIFGMLFGILTASIFFKDHKLYNECTCPRVASTVQYSDNSAQFISTLKRFKFTKEFFQESNIRCNRHPDDLKMNCPSNIHLRPKPSIYKVSPPLNHGVDI